MQSTDPCVQFPFNLPVMPKLLLTLLFGLLIIYQCYAEKSMFDICDENQDKKIDVRELGVCMNIIPNPDENEYESLNKKVAELMKVFDSNKDGSITMKEFGKATEKVQDPLGDEEYLDVTMADGTIKKIHKSELFNNVKDSSKGFEMKNDKIYKEEEKNGNITELTEKDPALGNMIRIGKWAAGQLNLLNFSSGLLLNLESLPNGGSVVSKERLQKEPELLGVKFNGPFEVRKPYLNPHLRLPLLLFLLPPSFSNSFLCAYSNSGVVEANHGHTEGC